MAIEAIILCSNLRARAIELSSTGEELRCRLELSCSILGQQRWRLWECFVTKISRARSQVTLIGLDYFNSCPPSLRAQKIVLNSPVAPPHKNRVEEIRELDQKLGVVQVLEDLGNVVKWTETSIAPSQRPAYYLLKYDNATDQVLVSPYFGPKDAIDSYDVAEFQDNVSGNNTTNVVLVEADRLENLRIAYPNYFGDVQLFKDQLKTIIGRRGLKEFKLKPQERVPFAGRALAADASWLRRHKFERPKGA